MPGMSSRMTSVSSLESVEAGASLVYCSAMVETNLELSLVPGAVVVVGRQSDGKWCQGVRDDSRAARGKAWRNRMVGARVRRGGGGDAWAFGVVCWENSGKVGV
jgi:hypothetical protein